MEGAHLLLDNLYGGKTFPIESMFSVRLVRALGAGKGSRLIFGGGYKKCPWDAPPTPLKPDFYLLLAASRDKFGDIKRAWLRFLVLPDNTQKPEGG